MVPPAPQRDCSLLIFIDPELGSMVISAASKMESKFHKNDRFNNCVCTHTLISYFSHRAKHIFSTNINTNQLSGVRDRITGKITTNEHMAYTSGGNKKKICYYYDGEYVAR